MPSLGEIYYLVVAILIFIIIFCGRKRRLSRLRSNDNDINISAVNNNNTPNNIQPSDGLTMDERLQQAKEDRRLKILTTVMHKVTIRQIFLHHFQSLMQRKSFNETLFPRIESKGETR